MKMKPFFILAVFVLLFPLVSAIDCSITSQPDYCEMVKSSSLSPEEKDKAYSSIIYPYFNYPNHEAVYEYNPKIQINSPPENVTSYALNYIKNAWMAVLFLSPSVYENASLFVPDSFKVNSGYHYDLYIPPEWNSKKYRRDKECKRKYFLAGRTESLTHYFNDEYVGSGKEVSLNIRESGEVKAEFSLQVVIGTKHYIWQKWRVGKLYVDYCEYSHTSYSSESVKITDKRIVRLYQDKPSAQATITDRYYNTTKGTFWRSNTSFFSLNFRDSNIKIQDYYYFLTFEKKPYYFAHLTAEKYPRTSHKNLYLFNDTFFVQDASDCSVYAYNHFYSISSNCSTNVSSNPKQDTTDENENIRIGLVLHTAFFILVLYLIYRLIQSQIKKVLPAFILILLLAPMALAAEDECGLTNLASCIPEKIYEYFLLVINAPLLPLLAFIERLFTAEVSIDLFHHLWSVIRYILSFFYIFLFIYAGYVFITGSGNPIRRTQAKEMLRDTFLMIILIQSSFYLYGLILSISSVLNSTMLSMIDPHFFMITADNIVNIGLELAFGLIYALTLLSTVFMLALRYAVVSIGVVLFPVALLCYFVPPLKGYGRFMLNLLGIFIFVTFIDLLIILGCSMLVQADVFENFKIVVMITCFTTINYTLWLAIKYALKRSANASIKDDLSQAAKYIAMLA